MIATKSDFFRIIIVGNSGSGKSWLAAELAKLIGTFAVDLDVIHWMPEGYGTRRDPEAAKKMVRDHASVERWIIEGVYGWLVQEALPSATTFIWLDLPEAECIENIRKRGVRRGGNAASFEALIVWAGEYRTRENANSYSGHAQQFDRFRGTKLRLRSRAEIADFLKGLSI